MSPVWWSHLQPQHSGYRTRKIRCLSSSSATWWVRDQPGLHEIWSQNTFKKNCKEAIKFASPYCKRTLSSHLLSLWSQIPHKSDYPETTMWGSPTQPHGEAQSHLICEKSFLGFSTVIWAHEHSYGLKCSADLLIMEEEKIKTYLWTPTQLLKP